MQRSPGTININIERLPANPEIKELLPELCRFFSDRLPELRKVYIYGSQARGDWNEDSDTDILLVIDEEIESGCHPGRSRFYRITDAALSFIHSHEGNGSLCLLSPITFTKDIDEITREDAINPALVDNIKREGVLIYARDREI